MWVIESLLVGLGGSHLVSIPLQEERGRSSEGTLTEIGMSREQERIEPHGDS